MTTSSRARAPSGRRAVPAIASTGSSTVAATIANASQADSELPRPSTSSTASPQPSSAAGAEIRNDSAAWAASRWCGEAPRVRESSVSFRRRSYDSAASRPRHASAQAKSPIAATESSVSACERSFRYCASTGERATWTCRSSCVAPENSDWSRARSAVSAPMCRASTRSGRTT